MKNVILLVLVSFAFSFTARADWQGKFKMKSTLGGAGAPKEASGVMRMKKEMTRMDMETPMKLSTIINTQSGKAWSLMHSQKVMLESDISKFEGQAPLCSAEDVDGCLKKRGFKKTGSEKVGGHACEIYEGLIGSKGGKNVKVKLWRPLDLKEVPSLKTVITNSDGGTAETLVSEVKLSAQDTSLFSVPADYKKLDVQNLMQSVGNLKPPGQ